MEEKDINPNIFKEKKYKGRVKYEVQNKWEHSSSGKLFKVIKRWYFSSKKWKN